MTLSWSYSFPTNSLFPLPFTTFPWAYLKTYSWTSYNSYFCNELDSTILVLYNFQKYFHLLFFKPVLKSRLLQSMYFSTPKLRLRDQIYMCKLLNIKHTANGQFWDKHKSTGPTDTLSPHCPVICSPSLSHHRSADDGLVHAFNSVCSPSLYLPTNVFLLGIQKDAESNPKMSGTELNIFPTDFHFKCPFVFFCGVRGQDQNLDLRSWCYLWLFILLSSSCIIKSLALFKEKSALCPQMLEDNLCHTWYQCFCSEWEVERNTP